MTSTTRQLSARHIQNFSEAQTLQPHWGYASRALPCTNDPGSCEYLDTVYHAHDVSMLYSCILWAAIGGTLFVWGIGRRLRPSRKSRPTSHANHEGVPAKQSSIYRLSQSLGATSRHFLLPDALRSVFGRITRLQVLVLAILVSYLTIFTFVGLVYKTWITPVKKLPGVYNTRTGLGPWSDRIGVFAFALTPLSVLLSSRESLLSLITGIPYQHFNFLHRWLGYIILIQSALHTVGWTVVEARLYQPQPKVWNEFISQLYMIWGVVAMTFLSVLFVLSTPWAIRFTGYEFFRKAHYVLAMLFIGACWGHWSQLSCWMIASLTVWLCDRCVRLMRTALLHYHYAPGGGSSMRFQTADASIECFPDPVGGDVIRLEFDQNHDPWHVGQHFFLCFPEISIWQAHPFTPCSLPGTGLKFQRHVYLLRGKKGETSKLALLAAAKPRNGKENDEISKSNQAATSVILTGPYGQSIIPNPLSTSDTNVMCIAGGTGITFVLPVLSYLVNQFESHSSDRVIEFIWAIRKRSDMHWMKDELDMLYKASQRLKITIRIFVTRVESNDVEIQTLATEAKTCFVNTVEEECSVSSPSSSSSSSHNDGNCSCSVHHATVAAAASPLTRHPDLAALVSRFVSSTVHGPTKVFASGPGAMISDLRKVVAACNSGARVWKGDERYDVELINDDRLEW